MQIVYVNADNLSQLQSNAVDSVMTLGYFDGVHKGHQAVIATAKKQATKHGLALAVLSFFPHPKSVLLPHKKMPYIEPLEQKAEKLSKLGVDIFYVVAFTKELSVQSPEHFLQQYVIGLQAKKVVCGFDYTYGHQAQGTTKQLRPFLERYNIECFIMEPYKWKHQKISSTRIRNCLQTGHVGTIQKLLGTYHQVKYCQKNGVLPYYTLPKKGHYHVFVNTGDALIPCLATVLCDKKVTLHCACHELPQVLTIQWIDHAQTLQMYV